LRRKTQKREKRRNKQMGFCKKRKRRGIGLRIGSEVE